MIKPYYKDANVTLFKADCREVLNQIDPCSVNMVMADPPYHLSNGGITCKSGEISSVLKGDWDKSNGFTEDYNFTREWIEKCKKVLVPGGSIFISGTHHNIHMIGYELQRQGFKIINDIIQVKKDAPPNITCKALAHKHEIIIWAAKGGLSYKFNYKWAKNTLFPDDDFKSDGKQMTDIWFINRTPKSEKTFGKHTTQKPIRLLERIVQMSTDEGDLILDPFGGVGTTACVAKKYNRECISIELDLADISINKAEGYYTEIAIKRLKNVTP